MTAIITATDKFKCAERELKMRQRVYPRWVDEKKMSAGKAELEIETMKAIVEDYRGAAEKERLL